MNICSPVNVEAHYYIDADRTCDLTNLHAALHDMLVHYNVIADDNRKIIVSTDGSRVHVDRKNPRTEVIVTPVNLENGA
jgi:Holliday junction resolvase RusA-like endonuclease